MDGILNEEAERLADTLEKYREAITDEQLMYDALPSLYRNDPDVLNDLMLQMHNHIARLKLGLGKPYFARIDFTHGSDGTAEKCYIGKIGVSDSANHIITVDWRSPVSTLYYDSNIGVASYDAPSGVISGTLDLKRQIEIEQGRLLSASDVDTVSNDDLLKPYLGANADSRLKNIVASIQGEQNRIIREKLEKSIVVQGAAGSGKTTVALHRIAYLAYTYRDTIRPKQYMVIGPNPFFISYISSVLPDLDVDSVPQCTFPELAKEFIHEDFTLADSYAKLREVIRDGAHSGVERFKTSMRYKEALDRFLVWFEATLPPDSDFAIRGFTVLTKGQVEKAYAEARVRAGGTIQARVDRCVLLLSGIVQNSRSALEVRLSDFFREQYGKARDSGELARMHKDREMIERELEKGCGRSLKNFFSRADRKALPLYRLFLQNSGEYIGPEFPEAAALKTSALALLRKKTLSSEDLPAVMYLKERVKGAGKYKEFRHVVVDEAQDYGEFELYALQRILPSSTFTVVGDLAQSIFGYRCVESWEPVLRDSFSGGAILCEMQRSYRTTVEIMEAANKISARLGLAQAQPVIRHGEPVGFHPVEAGGAAEVILRVIREYENMGYVSIAVISKTQEESDCVGERLRGLGLPIESVSAFAGQYTGGICAITAYQAKGLEFDGVILSDASEAAYASGRRMDLHLLYVAMTRPLHRLDLFYTGELAAALAAV